MYTIDIIDEEKYVQRVGDICNGHYVPVSLPGRYKYSVEDIENILYIWMNKKYKIKNKEYKDLYIFSLIFKETKFSLILCKSKYENNFCVWQVLWCAWKDIFKKSFEENNKYLEKYKNNIIDFQAGCIYLLFLLYFCQHVESNHYAYPLYMSPKTINLCLDVTEECEKRNIFKELRFILNFMIDSNSIILSCNDNLCEIYQDRYGAPLHIEKGKLSVENSIEINNVDLQKFFDHFINDIKDLSELCDEQRRKNTLSNTSTYKLTLKLENIKNIINKDNV
ncbi:conserved Plasmodium protein, unknown function [Plasmodium relictum]|uniref:Uncharacterized protein n=1 Tax=Plasmodium relictum TaxID=85471 RepID=A0A1J1HDQ2_PLARL|nr:conserved Plasmodium protein, unknown function [Plasmodium relictum]CRH03677.1 conserved Plasmodium protein, unknown function [Plasmodium relictum]